MMNPTMVRINTTSFHQQSINQYSPVFKTLLIDCDSSCSAIEIQGVSTECLHFLQTLLVEFPDPRQLPENNRTTILDPIFQKGFPFFLTWIKFLNQFEITSLLEVSFQKLAALASNEPGTFFLDSADTNYG